MSSSSLGPQPEPETELQKQADDIVQVARDILRAHQTQWDSVFTQGQFSELYRDTVKQGGLYLGMELLKLHQLHRLTSAVYYLADKVEKLG